MSVLVTGLRYRASNLTTVYVYIIIKRQRARCYCPNGQWQKKYTCCLGSRKIDQPFFLSSLHFHFIWNIQMYIIFLLATCSNCRKKHEAEMLPRADRHELKTPKACERNSRGKNKLCVIYSSIPTVTISSSPVSPRDKLGSFGIFFKTSFPGGR